MLAEKGKERSDAAGKTDSRTNPDIVRFIADFLPIRVYVLSKERKIRWINNPLFQQSGPVRAPVNPNRHCYEEMFGRKEPCDPCPALKAFASGRREESEIRGTYQGVDGYYLVTATPLEQGSQGNGLVVETVQDVTSWRETEERLLHLNDFNAAIIEHAPVAIFTIDQHGKFMSVNPALAVLSGLGREAEEKLLGFNWIKNPFTVKCGLADYIERGLAGEPFELQDFPFATYRGERNYLHFRGVPLRGKDGKVEALLCIIEDTSEKVKAKVQLIQDAKMSVIGRLMTGVAHELNNPLATIAANSELASEIFQGLEGGCIEETDLGELREYLEVIQSQAFRCKNIINDMIDLTRKDSFEKQEIDVDTCLSGLFSLMNFKKLKIRLVYDLAPGLPYVMADPNALKQCFMNMLQNAADAVEGKDDALIQVRVGCNGNGVRVEIEDNGIGIPEGLMERLFEPFFSTKGAGKGVGLGLTLCYDFVKRLGGSIEVESRPGSGSLFRVTLPAKAGDT